MKVTLQENKAMMEDFMTAQANQPPPQAAPARSIDAKPNQSRPCSCRTDFEKAVGEINV